MNRPTLVEAYSTNVAFRGLPSEIMYMPEGRSAIEARVDGEPKEIDVNVTAETAAILQADLEKLLAHNIRPYVDFDHKGEARQYRNGSAGLQARASFSS